MFTSRAEYRLTLRQDNCDERLMPIAYGLGTITQEQYDERRRFWDRKRDTVDWLGGVRVRADEYEKATGRSISQTETALCLLRRPDVGWGDIVKICGDVSRETLSDRHLALGVESDIKYEGFIRKQTKEIERIRRYEEAKIPNDFSYDEVPGLLTESREKLKKIRPSTLGQVGRIGGVTPADVSVLAMCLMSKSK
jgi:tRNA uridine 5-carboxymethylaminomethyl modification enzyme